MKYSYILNDSSICKFKSRYIYVKISYLFIIPLPVLFPLQLSHPAARKEWSSGFPYNLTTDNHELTVVLSFSGKEMTAQLKI